MIFVGCSGFPVPASRYWDELSGIEITETELGVPGDGTLRRWARESPKRFAFSMVAPKEVADSGFEPSAENIALILAVAEIAPKIRAKAIVFQAPEGFKPTPTHRKKVKAFLKALPKDFPTAIVLDFPEWKPAQILAAAEPRNVVAAYDPLTDDAPKGDFAYVRLPGPAGRRSRYDDEALAKIASHFQSVKSGDVLCVFRNQDMFVNAKAIQQVLK
ncbi:MAG: DUF72 domain-containing protein [Myxococcales bacterium]|nr:DUF72 domain-containing protein [Myxococcales bacterium]